MKLEIGNIHIKDMVFGERTLVEDGILHINENELRNILKEDPRIMDVKVDIAKPGDKTRIIPVKDVIEPRVKTEGEGNGFPGVTSKMFEAGTGKTKVLKGAAVVTIGDIVGFQEGIIDMWGEGGAYTPFSSTYNLVVDITPVKDLHAHEHEEAVRKAGLKAASYVGEAGRHIKEDELLVYNLESVGDSTLKYKDLPKVVYVQMLISQGLLHDTYIYGVDSKVMLPTFIHPNEILDGAVISGNCVAACDKITTYQHLNNSVILDLYNKHGKELNFLGVVMTPELTTLEGKIRSCNYATKIVKSLGADGVIVSEEGYGNPDADLLMICRRLEKDGIKTVLITDECAGRDGSSQSLADTAKEAKAVVSTGNVSHLVVLPAADKVIGNPKAIENLAGGYEGSLDEKGQISCELNAIIGATSEIGYHNVTVKGY
ncbi:glycine/sarcosine/betaine reductase component B subunit [Anaeromicrobium sediminis]|uniref:Beta-aspartyl-peptidase n=1 Tax=Anaeromicrobium sediminis TaxID=1478221 RepID=A0A267MNE3_9FIRM|nr:glycine/sarcosine/betaine reductase component B subunit [Anaeromicrobium sediminis]PAB61056.1 beta-aspartyl-peptidase [Anaeromicrobium sediminis]